MSEAPPPTPADTPAEAAARPPTLREWVRTHDESWIFVTLYLGMAVGLSVFVSLFWLVVVAGLHFGLELVRQRDYREGGRSVFLHALWEVKLDVGLVLLALMLVLYIEVVLGILGVQSAARAAAVTRAGARIGTRAAAWERTLRTVLLTFDEMIRIGHAGILMSRRRQKGKASPAAEGDTAPPGVSAPPDPGTLRFGPLPDAWSLRWKTSDRIGMALVVVGFLLIVAAPLLTPHDWGTAAEALVEELRPFPTSDKEP